MNGENKLSSKDNISHLEISEIVLLKIELVIKRPKKSGAPTKFKKKCKLNIPFIAFSKTFYFPLFMTAVVETF